MKILIYNKTITYKNNKKYGVADYRYFNNGNNIHNNVIFSDIIGLYNFNLVV